MIMVRDIGSIIIVILLFLIQVEETKPNNHNTNDQESVHVGTCLLRC